MAVESRDDTNTRFSETSGNRRKSYIKLVVFLGCVVISTLMWLFVELMKEYTDEINYGIRFTNVPNDLILTNIGDSLIKVEVKAQGFELLSAKYLQKNRTLNIDLSELKIRPTPEGYAAFLPSVGITDQLSKQLRYSNEITSIKPDTLLFKFSEVCRKVVPVRLDISYIIGSQYDITDSVVFSPREIIVSSIKSIIDTLKWITTEKLQIKNPDSTVVVKIPLRKGNLAGLMKFSSDSVTVKIPVQQVTEAVYKIPVTVESDAGKMKIFPDKVEVYCRVPLAEYPHIESSAFAANVVFDKNFAGEKLKVLLSRVPAKAKVLKIDPPEVEYIIISK